MNYATSLRRRQSASTPQPHSGGWINGSAPFLYGSAALAVIVVIGLSPQPLRRAAARSSGNAAVRGSSDTGC